MISFNEDNVRFNFRVSGVALHNGRVLLTTDEHIDYWYLPGGRVELLEAAEDTLRREMQEELGLEALPGVIKEGGASAVSAVYDTIGNNYDVTRKADPEIARRIYHHLQLDNGARVLDIGCGTGNYTISLQNMGLAMVGTDISSTMLKGASVKSSDIPWIKADVGNLPFKDSEFRGAISTLVIHHFPKLEAPFREAYRVISEGRFVIFTSSPKQMAKYWLVEYFPDAIQAACKQMPSSDKVIDALEKAGFSIAGIETFLVQPKIQDFFLYSGKYHPEIYLNSKVREGISTFASLEFADEVQEGCQRLKQDMDTGRIYDVFARYSSTAGDYMFIVAQKGRG